MNYISEKQNHEYSQKVSIVMTDVDRNITFVNQYVTELTGYSQDELIGKSCTVFQGPETDVQQIQSIKAALGAEQAFFGEILSYRKDGSSFWNQLTITPIFDSSNNLSQFIEIQRDITEQKQMELALLDSEKRFRKLADVVPVLIWQADIHKNRFWFNKGWLDFTGRSLQQEIGDGWLDSVHPEDRDYCLKAYYKCFEQHSNFRIEYRLKRFDGEYRWIDAHGAPHYSDDGMLDGYVGTCIDITNVRNSKAATDFFNVSHELIYTTDLNGIILDCNNQFCEVTGYSRDMIIGHHVRLLKSGKHDNSFYAEMWRKIKEEGFWRGEIVNRNKSGALYTAISTISIVRDASGKPHRYLGVASDISSIAKNRQELEHLAYYDNLTSLPNRLLLVDRLNQSMMRARRWGGYMAVVYIDLDGFKSINDHYGHDVGDEFLKLISQHMKNAVRESDTLARVGGDEFVLVLDGLERKEDFEVPVINVLHACNTPISLKGLALQASASIGINLYPSEIHGYGDDVENVLRCADSAMYIAKQEGKNRYRLFDCSEDEIITTRNGILEKIQNGLNKGEFVLYYQPKVNIRTGQLLGLEALIRWEVSENCILNPCEFLPIIQHHPLFIELNEWVIKSALSQLSIWQLQGFEVCVSVNVDARQLHQHNFIDRLQTAIAKYPNFRVGSLEFEVLETTALSDQHQAQRIIESCRALGIEFALDDFGTGYSSITYMKQLPVNTIKIDRSFIADMDKSVKDFAIVQNMVDLALTLEKKVVAEGVETVQQRDMLLKMGCEVAQGFVIAKPMPESDVLSWLRDWEFSKHEFLSDNPK